MSHPWYQSGLRFTCTQCGDCCTGEPGFVWVDDAELAAIAAFLGEPIDEVRGLMTRATARGRTLREKANGDCVFYEKGRGCTIYPVRPGPVSHLAVLGKQPCLAGDVAPNL